MKNKQVLALMTAVSLATPFPVKADTTDGIDTSITAEVTTEEGSDTSEGTDTPEGNEPTTPPDSTDTPEDSEADSDEADSSTDGGGSDIPTEEPSEDTPDGTSFDTAIPVSIGDSFTIKSWEEGYYKLELEEATTLTLKGVSFSELALYKSEDTATELPMYETYDFGLASFLQAGTYYIKTNDTYPRTLEINSMPDLSSEGSSFEEPEEIDLGDTIQNSIYETTYYTFTLAETKQVSFEGSYCSLYKKDNTEYEVLWSLDDEYQQDYLAVGTYYIRVDSGIFGNVKDPITTTVTTTPGVDGFSAETAIPIALEDIAEVYSLYSDVERYYRFESNGYALLLGEENSRLDSKNSFRVYQVEEDDTLTEIDRWTGMGFSSRYRRYLKDAGTYILKKEYGNYPIEYIQGNPTDGFTPFTRTPLESGETYSSNYKGVPRFYSLTVEKPTIFSLNYPEPTQDADYREEYKLSTKDAKTEHVDWDVTYWDDAAFCLQDGVYNLDFDSYAGAGINGCGIFEFSVDMQEMSDEPAGGTSFENAVPIKFDEEFHNKMVSAFRYYKLDVPSAGKIKIAWNSVNSSEDIYRVRLYHEDSTTGERTQIYNDFYNHDIFEVTEGGIYYFVYENSRNYNFPYTSDYIQTCTATFEECQIPDPEPEPEPTPTPPTDPDDNTGNGGSQPTPPPTDTDDNTGSGDNDEDNDNSDDNTPPTNPDDGDNSEDSDSGDNDEDSDKPSEELPSEPNTPDEPTEKPDEPDQIVPVEPENPDDKPEEIVPIEPEVPDKEIPDEKLPEDKPEEVTPENPDNSKVEENTNTEAKEEENRFHIKTGDTSNVSDMVSLFGVSLTTLLGGIGDAIRRRRKNKGKK